MPAIERYHQAVVLDSISVLESTTIPFDFDPLIETFGNGRALRFIPGTWLL